MKVISCFVLFLTFLLDISFAAPIVNGYFVVPTESTLLVYFAQLLSLKLLQFSMIQAALTHSNSTHNFQDDNFG